MPIGTLAAQSRPVGTRGGGGRTWGPCACPRRGTSSGEALRNPTGICLSRGQAQGPHPSPHPPLVPTEPGRTVSRHCRIRLSKFENCECDKAHLYTTLALN